MWASEKEKNKQKKQTKKKRVKRFFVNLQK